jgi:hypothetical protein
MHRKYGFDVECPQLLYRYSLWLMVLAWSIVPCLLCCVPCNVFCMIQAAAGAGLDLGAHWEALVYQVGSAEGATIGGPWETFINQLEDQCAGLGAGAEAGSGIGGCHLPLAEPPLDAIESPLVGCQRSTASI